jgi:CheY-like chemotaxis protein
MPVLLFISDNPKAEQIRDLLQPILKLEIGVTADVERAMEVILTHPPSVICIQEQMAGTTAEEIVRQIRTIPENGAPLLVLLREENDTVPPHEQLFKHVIDLSLPVEQLLKSILRAVLQSAFKRRWSDIHISRKRDLPTISHKEETEPDRSPAAATKGQIPAELLKAFEHNYRSRRRGKWMRLAAVSLAACLAVFVLHLTLRGHDRGGTISQTPSARPAAQRPTATPVPPAKKSTPTPAPSSAAIVRKVAAAPRKPAPGTATTSKLPSFIPKKGRDSAYSRQNPGWERYTDAIHEFRILRSGNRIKTVQVLAATPDTISEAFLKSVLGEISGTNTYRETSQKEEHGFLVKRCSTGPGVKILIYTQESRIRAFVISIS